PVKLFSSELLAMALALLALDARRLLDLLVFNRATEPVEHAPHFRRRGLRIAGNVVKGVIISGLLGLHAWSGWNSQRTYTDESVRSPLYGIYEASTLVEDGQIRPGLISDGERWRYLIFDHPGLLSVQRVDGSIERYSVEFDEQAGSFELWRWAWPMAWMYIDPPEQEPIKTTWTYARPSPDRLELAGEIDGRAIEIVAEARDPQGFFLVERGFNWINEVPLNR
ncbi:MAG TPA: hypothetical protein VM869_24410, partial [Enhygromyxa sp.]|nr:hypothetical protein [Enhygromyxa sp.]